MRRQTTTRIFIDVDKHKKKDEDHEKEGQRVWDNICSEDDCVAIRMSKTCLMTTHQLYPINNRICVLYQCFLFCISAWNKDFYSILVLALKVNNDRPVNLYSCEWVVYAWEPCFTCYIKLNCRVNCVSPFARVNRSYISRKISSNLNVPTIHLEQVKSNTYITVSLDSLLLKTVMCKKVNLHFSLSLGCFSTRRPRVIENLKNLYKVLYKGPQQWGLKVWRLAALFCDFVSDVRLYEGLYFVYITWYMT